MADDAGKAAISSATGGGGDDSEDRYYGQLAASFSLRYEEWMKDENRRPQTQDEYEENLVRTQTSTCTRMAALHYEIQKGVVLENITGIDSHMFRCNWVSPGDHRLCFHVTFHASVLGRRRRKSFFFAELVGTNGPESVNICVLMENTNDNSVKNCKFCSGMWHPVTGGFLGHKVPPAAAV